MKLFNKDPYQNVIDFIDARHRFKGDDALAHRPWENLPDNLRSDHLAKMRKEMQENGEPEKMIDIVRSINNREILSAVNLVVK